MKKICLSIFLFPLALMAKSFLVSNVPVPTSYVQNLDPYSCGTRCLQNFVDDGMIFSFLAHADEKLDDEALNEIRSMNIRMFNLGSTIRNTKLKIALLLPYKRIGKYASSTTNASFAYLITKNQSFELKSYRIENETQEEIRTALQAMDRDGFSYVIAPLTTKVKVLRSSRRVFFVYGRKKDMYLWVQSYGSFSTFRG